MEVETWVARETRSLPRRCRGSRPPRRGCIRWPSPTRLATSWRPPWSASSRTSCGAALVDVATVVDRRAELVDLVPRLAQEAGLDAAGIPAEAVVDAASALRCRELGGIGSGAFEGA